jgi:hypothetical protein
MPGAAGIGRMAANACLAAKGLSARAVMDLTCPLPRVCAYCSRKLQATAFRDFSGFGRLSAKLPPSRLTIELPGPLRSLWSSGAVMTFKQLGSLLFFMLVCAPVVTLGALTLRVSQLRDQLAQQEAKVLTLDAQLAAAGHHIERMEAEGAARVVQREESGEHEARAIALTNQLTSAHTEIERLQAEVAASAGVKDELARQHTATASFVQELTVAHTEIERLQAEVAASAGVKDELAQQHNAAFLIQELAAARSEIERLRHEAGAHTEAKGPTQHGSEPGLTRELAASRLEIARLKNEAEAAVERARGWRARFVAELQRKEPMPDKNQ